MYSPRVRGLSEQRFRIIWLERVFPPCAGVIGGALNRYPLAGSIPPVCGGYRSCCPRLPAGWKYSPRMRGLSEVFDLIQKGTDVFPRMRGLSGTLTDTFCTVLVFPPCAGVIGYQWGKIFICKCISPACGGYRNISGNPLRRILPACGGYRRKRQPS